MNDLQIFSNPEFGNVRTIEIDEEPYFVGKDVSTILGYAQTNNMKKLLDADDCIEINPQSPDFTGFIQNGGTPLEPNTNIFRMLLINESGLYTAIFNSTLPKAKQFKKWITSEVIPSIRKTGSYGIPQMSQSELILKIAQNNLQLEKRIAETENQTKAVSERLDNALDVFTQPVAEDWKDETNRIINRMIEEYNLNYGVFRRKLYDELEQIAICDLHKRQTNLRKRMERAGATYKERQEISLIDVIARDDKLKAIFDGIVRKYMAKYTLGKAAVPKRIREY